MKKAKLLLSTSLFAFALLTGLQCTSLAKPMETHAEANTTRFYFDTRAASIGDYDWVAVLQTYNDSTKQDEQHACTRLFDHLWVIDIDMTPFTGCKFGWAHSGNIHDVIDGNYYHWNAKTGANYCLAFPSYNTEWHTIGEHWEAIGRENINDAWGSLTPVPLTEIGFSEEYGIRFSADTHLKRHSDFCFHSERDEWAGITNSNINDLYDRGDEINQLQGYPYMYHSTTGACFTARQDGSNDNNFLVCEEGDYRIGVYPLVAPRACVYARGVEFPFQDSQCYIRGTVKSLGLNNDWTKGVPIGQWTYGQGNQWYLGKFNFTEGDKFKFYIEGFGEHDGWIGIEAWDERTTDDMGFTTDAEGNIYAPHRDLYMHITENWDGSYTWYGQHVCAAYINGRVESLGLDGDSVNRAPLPDWKGIYLKTTDHFHITRLDHFYRTFDNQAIRQEDTETFDLLAANPEPDDHEIRVKVDGYYDFVNISDAWFCMRKSTVESAKDGMYIGGESGHWSASNMRKMTQIGPNRYVVGPLRLNHADEIKCVSYKGGVSHWCEWSTYSSTNYHFPVSEYNDNLYIENGGDYYLVLTKDGDFLWNYHFMDPAEGWASMFLRCMTCDGEGVEEPEFAEDYSWASLKAAFATLDDESKKRIYGATADANGDLIEEAIARYEILVAGHGYEAFVRNASGTLRASSVASYDPMVLTKNSELLLLLVLAAAAVAAIIPIAIHNRKRHQ
ncbi:MAG: hypothetical protein K6E59_04915 [Bacilli bacterium]|nr:hypothetical protein [Bacilli bacterium]